MDGMGWDGWDGRLSPSASLLRAPYGANKKNRGMKKLMKNKEDKTQPLLDFPAPFLPTGLLI